MIKCLQVTFEEESSKNVKILLSLWHETDVSKNLLKVLDNVIQKLLQQQITLWELIWNKEMQG